VIKTNSKISKISAYIVLLCYLTITITYVFHHHNVDLEKSSSILTPTDKNQTTHSYLNDSLDFCPVQTAYNSLQNTIISFSNPYQHYEKKIDILDIFIVSNKPLKSYILHYSLRAPPKVS
jgi:hypothetical protein